MTENDIRLQETLITLYSTNCTNCKILEKRLVQKNIKYNLCNDKDIMKSKGFMSSPILEVNNNYMNYNDALEWVDEYNEE